jgi:hypothetical protein
MPVLALTDLSGHEQSTSCSLLQPTLSPSLLLLLLLLQVGLSWLDRWAKNLSGKDQGPFLCHQICGALLAAEQTGAALWWTLCRGCMQNCRNVFVVSWSATAAGQCWFHTEP